jgi:hypothetical protein
MSRIEQLEKLAITLGGPKVIIQNGKRILNPKHKYFNNSLEGGIEYIKHLLAMRKAKAAARELSRRKAPKGMEQRMGNKLQNRITSQAG